MPEIGEVRYGKEFGYKNTHKVIWTACADCGLKRWVEFKRGKANGTICQKCNCKRRHLRGDRSYLWKGGRNVTTSGYIRVKLQPDDFFFPMGGKTGYVFEHRLVMAQSLGRCLQPYEKVHHKGITLFRY